MILTSPIIISTQLFHYSIIQNQNQIYSPSPEIKFAHQFSQNYHYNFNDSIQVLIIKIITTPLVITIIGILCIIGFCITLLFSCFKCCQYCHPNPIQPNTDNRNYNNITLKYNEYNLRITLIIIIILFLISNQFTLVADYKYFIVGLNNYYNFIEFLKKIINKLLSSIIELLGLIMDIDMTWNTLYTNCISNYIIDPTIKDYVDSITGDINQLNSTSNMLHRISHSIDPYFDTIEGYLRDYGIHYHNYPFFGVW